VITGQPRPTEANLVTAEIEVGRLFPMAVIQDLLAEDTHYNERVKRSHENYLGSVIYALGKEGKDALGKPLEGDALNTIIREKIELWQPEHQALSKIPDGEKSLGQSRRQKRLASQLGPLIIYLSGSETTYLPPSNKREALLAVEQQLIEKMLSAGVADPYETIETSFKRPRHSADGTTTVQGPDPALPVLEL